MFVGAGFATLWTKMVLLKVVTLQLLFILRMVIMYFE